MIGWLHLTEIKMDHHSINEGKNHACIVSH